MNNMNNYEISSLLTRPPHFPILVLKPELDGELVCSALRQHGMLCYHWGIQRTCFNPLLNATQQSDIVQQISQADCVISLSRAANNFANDLLQQHQQHWPSSCTYWGIGSSTALALQTYTGQTCYFPEKADSDGLIDALSNSELLANPASTRRIVILCGLDGRQDLHQWCQRQPKISFFTAFLYHRETIPPPSFLHECSLNGDYALVLTSGEQWLAYRQYQCDYGWALPKIVFVPSLRISQLVHNTNADIITALTPSPQHESLSNFLKHYPWPTID